METGLKLQHIEKKGNERFTNPRITMLANLPICGKFSQHAHKIKKPMTCRQPSMILNCLFNIPLPINLIVGMVKYISRISEDAREV